MENEHKEGAIQEEGKKTTCQGSSRAVMWAGWKLGHHFNLAAALAQGELVPVI